GGHGGRALPGRRPRGPRGPADPGPARLRALLRRDGRDAARDPRALRRPGQPGPRARAPQALLPAIRLRATGGGARRRSLSLARPRAELPPLRRAPLPLTRGRPRDACPGAAPLPDVPGALALDPRPGPGRPTPAGRTAHAAAHPADGGGRSPRRGLPRSGGLPGER